VWPRQCGLRITPSFLLAPLGVVGVYREYTRHGADSTVRSAAPPHSRTDNAHTEWAKASTHCDSHASRQFANAAPPHCDRSHNPIADTRHRAFRPAEWLHADRGSIGVRKRGDLGVLHQGLGTRFHHHFRLRSPPHPQPQSFRCRARESFGLDRPP